MASSYLFPLHVPCDDVDANPPVGEVAVQLLSTEQGTASQHTALQETPGRQTSERQMNSWIKFDQSYLAEGSERAIILLFLGGCPPQMN